MIAEEADSPASLRNDSQKNKSKSNSKCNYRGLRYSQDDERWERNTLWNVGDQRLGGGFVEQGYYVLVIDVFLAVG